MDFLDKRSCFWIVYLSFFDFMKQILLTICLILFALPIWGQTTFSGGKIIGDFHSQLYSKEVNGLIREYSIKPHRGTIDFDERDKFFNSKWRAILVQHLHFKIGYIDIRDYKYTR